MTQENKNWYMSKSKWAGILTGVGLVLPGIINWLNGGAIPVSELWIGLVAILAVFGIRDLPVLNKK